MNGEEVLSREIAAFEAHRAELASTAAGKYALVHGDDIAAVHLTEQQAISDGRTRFGYAPILVELITSDSGHGPPANTADVPGDLSKPMLAPITWRQAAGALLHFGPTVKIKVGMTGAASEAFSRDGGITPAPIRGWALIDTGATFSLLDEQLIAELGLQPVGRIDLAGSDSVRTGLRYDAEIVFEDVMPLGVIASTARLRRPGGSRIPGYDALIGRDALANAVMTYDGIGEAVTLQFRAPDSDTANSARTGLRPANT